MRESSLERRITKYCNSRGWHCLKLECGSSAGFPDRTVLKPGGETIFLEVKRPHGGVRSMAQKVWIAWLNEAGFKAGFVKTFEEARMLLDETP